MAAPWEQFQSQTDAKPWEKFQVAPTKPDEPFGQMLNRELSNIPRQIGLTARHGLEGIGEGLDFLSSPIRGAMNMALPDSMQIRPGAGKVAADFARLPEPQDSRERMVGDAARLMAGSALPLGMASKASTMTAGVPQAVAKLMAANPAQQIASSGAAGLAGGYTRETGGDAGSQFAASLAAGLATPFAMNSAQNIAQSGTAAVKNMMNPASPTIQVDVQINNALKNSGLTLADLPANVASSIRNDVAGAMKIGGDLSPDAVRRLADYRLTGLTPTQAGLTLDPAIVTRQKNLAKVGINSKDATAQQLGQLENANNTRMIGNLNDLGATKGMESEIAGGAMAGRLNSFADQQRARISELYGAARDSSGRSANLDPSHFSQTAGDALRKANLEAFIPAEIRSSLNGFAEGKIPLSVDTAEQFKTIIGNAQRASNDGNVRTALGILRSSLDDTPLIGGQGAAAVGGNQVAVRGTNPIGGGNVGQEAIDAYSQARKANRGFMQTVENTPALKSVLDDASSKGFFQKHVIAGDSKSLSATLGVVGDEGKQQIKDQVLMHLKEKALSGATDEVGKFSQSQFNSALKMLGSRKLELLFSPEEISQLRALGRVASYEQVQPAGTAVNNSNTAGGMAGLFERIGNSPLMSKLPLGKQLAEPFSNIAIGMNSNRAMNVPQSLTSPRLPAPPQGLLLSPSIFMQNQDEEQRRRGLLAP